MNGLVQHVTFSGWLFLTHHYSLQYLLILGDIFESGLLSRYACFTGDIQNLVLILEKIKLSLCLVVGFDSAQKIPSEIKCIETIFNGVISVILF